MTNRSTIRRLLLHLLFWSLYFFQNVLLIFFVNSTRHSLPTWEGVLLAVENCLVLLLPKMTFTYFLFAFGLGRAGTAAQARKVLYSVGALVASLVHYRILVYYFIDPYIYGWNSGLALFNTLSLLVALMDIGFVTGVALAIRQSRLQNAYRLREEQLQRERLETELRFLRSQMHPHFLFNTLNNIYALARKRSEHTAETVLRLSKLLRFMLYESGKPFITIAAEMRLLEDYIALETIRYDDRLSVDFSKNVDDELRVISPLLLLPLVENAFKHGPGDTHLAAVISISLEVKRGVLSFVVSNSLESGGAPEVGAGIGLVNLRRQLELLYPNFTLDAKSQSDRFVASLTIMLNAHEKNTLPIAGR
ncbi:MAG: histidine kinase [Chitinophagaceae bacterium]|nr:MAG: histidine kinase [Chitinophagaceae bacterium]